MSTNNGNKLQLQSALNKLLNEESVFEFNEMADEMKIQFETLYGLAHRMERKLNEFNAAYERILFSMVNEDVYSEMVAASPQLKVLVQSSFDDELKLRMKIRSILEMSASSSTAAAAEYDQEDLSR